MQALIKTILTPQYDPYDQDILYKDKRNAPGANKDSIRKAAIDETTIKTINFTNVRFGQTPAKPKLWSISNFDFSYSFTRFEETSPVITQNTINKYRGGFGYTYNSSPKYYEPFKKLSKSKKQLVFIIQRFFNLNPNPTLLSFSHRHRASIRKICATHCKYL